MDSRTTWALDSGFLSYLDSGFHCLDSGFQDSGFRIPKPTKSRIPDSGLPHNGREALLWIRFVRLMRPMDGDIQINIR
jgi:hypothetical protein